MEEKMSIKLLVPFVLLGFGILFTAIYVHEKLQKYDVKELLLKTTCSMLFMGVAISSATLHRTGLYSSLMIIGLLFGLLGDIWLDLKYIYPADDTIYTYSGFTSFGIGHIFFITALIYRFGSFATPVYYIIPAVGALLLGFGSVAMGPVMKLDYGKFKGITRAYATLLGGFTLLAGSFALLFHFKYLALDMLFVGAVSFLISDLVLSGTYFGGKESPIDIHLNYIFYYGGQFLIALSLLFA